MKISKSKTKPIVDWAINNAEFINNRKDERGRYIGRPGNHAGESFGILNLDSEKVQEELKDYNFPYSNLISIDKELRDIYNIPKDSNTSKMGWILMYSKEGYICRPHKDKNVGDMIHTRLNVMISKPEEGGEPIIAGHVIKREENEPWICVAGKYEHSTVETKGETPRILLSFGYLVDEEIINKNEYLN